MQENMKLDQLEYFGIPSYLIQIWKKYYSETLLPVQEKAVRRFNLLQVDQPYCPSMKSHNQSKPLLVISPSSSGKTLVAEMAAIQEISLHRKVIYLVPLRALAEEKYEHFSRLYCSIGVKIKISSHDHRKDDQDIIQGNFHVAIIVYEKFYYLFLQYSQFLENVSLLIADEIQFINDPERGPRLENIFHYLQIHHPFIRIIALSAFMENVQHLAEWLNASILFSAYRPVELRKGIVRKGVYQYIEHNTNTIGQEIFFPEDNAEECNLASYLKSTLDYLIKQNETNLIFFSTKREVRLWSRWLANQFTLPPSRKVIDKLGIIEDSTSKEELISFLQAGIAYHCADLSWQERHLIEDSVREGNIKMICSTDTLSMGINLPVHNVILTGQKIISSTFNTSGKGCKGYENPWGNYLKRALTISEVENMGGRAGRLNEHKDFGRIIFLAPSLIELTAYQKLYFNHSARKAVLLPQYFTPASPEYPLQICENHANSYNQAQTMLTPAAGILPDCPDYTPQMPMIIEKDIRTFILQQITLECQSVDDILGMIRSAKERRNGNFWHHKFTLKIDGEEILTYLKQLEKEKLIRIGDDQKKLCLITEMGSLIIAKGISFQSYIHFQKWLRESQKSNVSELEILLLIANSLEGENLIIPYPRQGIIQKKKSCLERWTKYLHLRMLSLIFEHGEDSKPIFRNHLDINRNSDVHLEQNRSSQLKRILAIKKTLLMYDWINGRELREIEEDYGILSGAIQKIGEGFSWLNETLAAIASKTGWQEQRNGDLEKIHQLSARLTSGIGPEGLALAQLGIPGLTRGYIQRLVQEGYDSEQCLKELNKEQLRTIFPDLLVEKITNHLYSLRNDAENGTKKNIPLTHLTKDSKKDNKEDIINHAIGFKENEKEPVIKIDTDRPDQIFFFGETIAVNRANFQLISLLAQNQGKMVSYEQIIDILWPDDEDATYHRLWYHLGELRNSMQEIITKNGLSKSSVDYLKEKILKVLPGRGLLLEKDVPVKINENNNSCNLELKSIK